MPRKSVRGRYFLEMKVLGRHGVSIGVTLWLAAGVLWLYASLHTPHAIAQAIPSPGASTNAYWAGYVDGSRGPFHDVQASWTVPAAPCPTGTKKSSTAYVWIGEGGYLRGLLSPLIQAGTGSDCVQGMPRYHAFYEWYPGIYAADFPISIRPGDTVTVHLHEATPDYWLLTVSNDTLHQISTTATNFHADAQTADFIVERPNLCNFTSCSQPALARFHFITFHNVRVGIPGNAEVDAARDAEPIALINPDSHRLLAIPARVGSLRGMLSVVWQRDS